MQVNLVWRLIALATLFIYALLVFIVILLLAHNIAFAIVLGLSATLLVYAVWLLLSASGKHLRRARLTLVAGLVLFAADIIYFIADPKNRRAFLVVAGLSAFYLGLVAMLRKKYWAQKRALAEGTNRIARFKNPYLIINPKSGNGRAIKAHIDELAEKQGIHVYFTDKENDVGVLAQQAVRMGADVLGISGGDGSIGAAAKAGIENNIPVVVLPGGTRCHFARDLGLDPKRIEDALSGFTGVERRIDVADINGRIFLNNVSFGLYADIVDHPDYREHKMRVSWDTMHSLASGATKLYDLRFRKGAQRFHQAAQVLVGVNRYNTVDVFELGHRERLDEGVLQITAITELDYELAKRLVRAVSIDRLSKQADSGALYQWTAKTFRVDTAHDELVAGVDGEREVYAAPVMIHIRPGALRVFVPAEGERHRPKNPFTTPVLRRVWQAAVH